MTTTSEAKQAAPQQRSQHSRSCCNRPTRSNNNLKLFIANLVDATIQQLGITIHEQTDCACEFKYNCPKPHTTIVEDDLKGKLPSSSTVFTATHTESKAEICKTARFYWAMKKSR